uniref:Fibronectin type-III domain-containing protein n=1 Tax=viral metagenome TaxID=1070528 RepID=A0A6C0LPX3_9ZZZZ
MPKSSAPASLPTVQSKGYMYYTFTGDVFNDGGEPVTDKGVVFSNTNNYPTLADSKQSNVPCTGTGGITVSISEYLNPDKIYYFQAYATNSVGTRYGGVITAKA